MTLQAAPPFPGPVDAGTSEASIGDLTIVRAEPSETHTHDRGCWWDLTACRWAGPAHPDRRVGR